MFDVVPKKLYHMKLKRHLLTNTLLNLSVRTLGSSYSFIKRRFIICQSLPRGIVVKFNSNDFKNSAADVLGKFMVVILPVTSFLYLFSLYANDMCSQWTTNNDCPFQRFIPISAFYPHFSVLPPFQRFIPISAFYPHFCILSPFQRFTPISAFYPHFSVLSPFQRFIPISAFYPHFSVLSPFQRFIPISAFYPPFQRFIPISVSAFSFRFRDSVFYPYPIAVQFSVITVQKSVTN